MGVPDKSSSVAKHIAHVTGVVNQISTPRGMDSGTRLSSLQGRNRESNSGRSNWGNRRRHIVNLIQVLPGR
jgi:hypothetical protein